jgi:hypothetical protein
MEVLREDFHQQYRADIVIHWCKGRSTHIEVKIGDDDLAKTFETAEKVMAKHAATTPREGWTHYILLLRPQCDHWLDVARDDRSGLAVAAVTWDDVCVAIRRVLAGSEAMPWNVWAWTYLGATEQKLIGYDPSRPVSLSGAAIDPKIEILTRGLGDGE